MAKHKLSIASAVYSTTTTTTKKDCLLDLFCSFPQHSAAYRQQRPIAVQQPVQHEQLQQYHQEEYRPQYRSTAAQSHYEPRAAAAAYRPQEGQPVHQGYQVPSAGLGSGRYTVNF